MEASAIVSSSATGRIGRNARSSPSIAAMAAASVGLFALLWLRDWGPIVGRLGEPNGVVAVDYQAYMEATRQFLAGGSFYPAYQLAGPFGAESFPILYPPQAIVLFAPFTVLPAILWWLIPIAVVVGVVARLRPHPFTWPVLALCLWWPFTTTKILTGNPSLWLTAFLALGTIWRPWSALVLLKPTLAPFALFGVRDRRWRVVAALAALPFAWLLPDYLRVAANFLAPGGLLYSALEIPMLSIPLVAWLGRRRGERSPVTVPSVAAAPVEPEPA
jgi:hypothetical protein